MAKSAWSTIGLKPLLGMLDTRSSPADLVPGAYRWKENVSVSPEGQMGRRAGFEKAWADYIYDAYGTKCDQPGSHCTASLPDGTPDPLYAGTFYHNHDLHYVGATREPITFLQEVTWGDKSRQLFAGSQSYIKVLSEAAGSWADVTTGKGSFGSYWTAAFLQDTVLFTNDVNNILAYPQGGPAAEIPALRDTMHVTAARIAIEFNGVVMLMNIVQDGQRQSARIIWCDLNLPLDWDQAKEGTQAGQQDLDYGDEILAAGFLLGSVYIYTRRKIWRCTVASTAENAFNFQTVYEEPKNQTGCLAYPRTLISTGSAHYYASRDAIYRYSPFVAAPVRDDWLFRASGVMYTQDDTRMSGVICTGPVAEYLPSKGELWFSWPSGSNTVNNYTLVAQVDHSTADVVDAGFTTFVNFRRVPLAAALCNEVQSFIGASGEDYCLKDIGGVYYREFVTLGQTVGSDDPTVDIAEDATDNYVVEGYFSILRGEIPLGYYDREKVVKNVLIEDYIPGEEDVPCMIRLKVGNSYTLADPNSPGGRCTVQWRDLGTKALECHEARTSAQMAALNQRASEGTEWACYEMGRRLYYEFRVESAEGDEAIGGATRFERIDFTVSALAGP